MDCPTALSVTSVEMTPIAPTPAAFQHSTGSRNVAGRASPSIGACPYADRPTLVRSARARPGRARPGIASARGPLHQVADPCLFGRGERRQGVGDRPHGAVVEARVRLEAERCVPHLELRGGLE